MKHKIRIDSYWWIVILAAVFKLVIHLSIAGNYILHRDAYLYIAQSDHLAWGYWSVPPLTAFLIRLIRDVLGDSVYSLRLLPALTGVITVFVIGDAVRLLGGKKPALIIALFAFIFSIAYLRSNSLLQPVSNDELLWFLTFYFTVKLIHSQNTRYWLILGIVIGLGILNKYLIVFLVLGFLMAFLLTENRKLLWSRNLLLGLLLGFIIIFPNVLWQYHHNWVVLYHMKLLRQDQLVNVSMTGFFVGIILMNLSGIAVWLYGLYIILFGKEYKQYRVIGLAVIFVILLIAWLQGKPYYTLGVYTILFVFGGVAVEKYIWNHYKITYYILLSIIPLLLIPVVPFAVPVLKFRQLKSYCSYWIKKGLDAPMRWEDGKVHDIPQDYADMTGWDELAMIVSKTYHGLTSVQQNETLIYAENYGEAGAINYYGKKLDLPPPVCFNGSFLFWAPDSLKNIKYLIYVNNETKDIKRYFKIVNKSGEVRDPYFREGNLPVFLCSEPLDSANEFYKDIVIPLKKQFIRNYP